MKALPAASKNERMTVRTAGYTRPSSRSRNVGPTKNQATRLTPRFSRSETTNRIRPITTVNASSASTIAPSLSASCIGPPDGDDDGQRRPATDDGTVGVQAGPREPRTTPGDGPQLRTPAR